MFTVDVSALRFAAPGILPLLAVPAMLLALWIWQLWRRRRDIAALRRQRRLAAAGARISERLPALGELPFWLCLIGALSCLILALARPVAVASTIRTGGIDLVILQDASASMRVRDVAPDRWRRSMRFLRTLGESLRWEDDRIALAIFATIAAPQIRLTRDPNTFFFFLDHLQDAPPFRLEDETTWDTNIERGIYWGLRLIEKDAELGRDTPASLRDNPKAFVLISDGQAWSGRVATSIALARERQVPLYVIGVGTPGGGVIPEPGREPGRAPVFSQLDRASLAAIASSGGGRYFELDRGSDRDIAVAIIDATRRRAARSETEETAQELYWMFLALAAALLVAGHLFLRDRASLALSLAAAGAALIVLARAG